MDESGLFFFFAGIAILFLALWFFGFSGIVSKSFRKTNWRVRRDRYLFYGSLVSWFLAFVSTVVVALKVAAPIKRVINVDEYIIYILLLPFVYKAINYALSFILKAVVK